MEDTNISDTDIDGGCIAELPPEELAIHNKYMEKAIAQARRAYANGDVH